MYMKLISNSKVNFSIILFYLTFYNLFSNCYWNLTINAFHFFKKNIGIWLISKYLTKQQWLCKLWKFIFSVQSFVQRQHRLVKLFEVIVSFPCHNLKAVSYHEDNDTNQRKFPAICSSRFWNTHGHWYILA